MLPIHSAYCACIGRSSPRSWRSAASVGAYAWPSTMRVATSPGMRRSSRNTITLTRKSVGTARATRRSTYCFIGLLVEPGEEQSHAEAVPVVVPETLHVSRMRDVLRGRRGGHHDQRQGQQQRETSHRRSSSLRARHYTQPDRTGGGARYNEASAEGLNAENPAGGPGHGRVSVRPPCRRQSR